MDKRQLFDVAEQGLRNREGWAIERTGSRNTSERRIVRGSERHLVSIKTSRDTYFGFGRSGASPENYDFIVVASVDKKENPTEIRVHKFPGIKVAERLAAHREARRANGESGEMLHNWLSLYTRDYAGRYQDPGGGLGLDFPPIFRVPLGLLGEPLDIPAPTVNVAGQSQEPIIGRPVQRHADPIEMLRQLIARFRAEGLTVSISITANQDR
jgi:hypothetical protein